MFLVIVLACFFTAFCDLDKLFIKYKAGLIVPITGFSNSIASPAIEFKKEGIIFGLCVKMFSVAGPVIVNGIAVSVLVGIVYLFL